MLDAVEGNPSPEESPQNVVVDAEPPKTRDGQFSGTECWESVVSCKAAAGVTKEVLQKVNCTVIPQVPQLYDADQLPPAGKEPD